MPLMASLHGESTDVAATEPGADPSAAPTPSAPLHDVSMRPKRLASVRNSHALIVHVKKSTRLPGLHISLAIF